MHIQVPIFIKLETGIMKRTDRVAKLLDQGFEVVAQDDNSIVLRKL